MDIFPKFSVSQSDPVFGPNRQGDPVANREDAGKKAVVGKQGPGESAYSLRGAVLHPRIEYPSRPDHVVGNE